MKRRVPADARLEIKFVAPESEVFRLEQWLRLHPAGFYQPHPERWVNNLYFDTHHFFAYTENLSGASYRTKLRYRWYGQHAYPIEGALEVKCKRNYFGWKLRYPIGRSPYSEGANWRDIHQSLIEQAGPEGRRWLEANPQPVIINRYHRRYYVSGDDRIRATIDVEQSLFDQRYKPFPNVSNAANAPRTLVVEIKFDRGDRELASRVIQGIPVRVSRNSKYIIGLKAVQGF